MPEQVEKRVEYRVVGEHFGGERFETKPISDLAKAKERLLGFRSGGARNGRIQERIRTPWEDVADV